MGIEGAIAVANLILMGAALLVLLAMFPDGLDYGSATKGEILVAETVKIVVVVLAFPVGWISCFVEPVHGPPLTAMVFVPLNAYVWGYSVAAFLRFLKARRSR